MNAIIKDHIEDENDTLSLQILLESYRKAARTEREKGTYFERLAVSYLTNDPVQIGQHFLA